MEDKDINTKQSIMQAAENEFINKGYAGAKMTEIAKRAGVNHAMLHYYFRNKENLFNIVFLQKVKLFASSFANTFDKKLPLFEKIRLGIEAHFDIMAENPRLPFFVYSEIITNEERKNVFIKTLIPNVSKILDELKEQMESEIKKGTIKAIEPLDLLINVVSLNVFPFLADPFLSVLVKNRGLNYNEILKQRRENNVQLILNSLRA